MAVTIQSILASLNEAHLRYKLHELTGEPLVVFPTDQYVNNSGTNHLMIVIQLTEDGEYVKFFVPSAYHIPEDESAYAVLKSFSIIAWQVKLLDFEVDPSDGEVRPTIDFPIEDGTLTTLQIQRCCRTLARLVDIFHPYIKSALVNNKVPSELSCGDIGTVLRAYDDDMQVEPDAIPDLDRRFREMRERLATLEEEEEEHEEDETTNTGDSDSTASDSSENKDAPQEDQSQVASTEEDSSDDEWI